MVPNSRNTATSAMLIAALFAVVLVCVQCTILGGYQSVDVNDEDVQKYADFALRQLNAKMNNYFYMKITNILNASVQVVSGKMYYLTIEISPTECTSSGTSLEDVDLRSCKLNENSQEKPQICEVKVWVQLWKNRTEMTESKCSPEGN